MAENRRCEHRKAGNGKRCKAYARINDRFCFFHSAQTAQARKKAQRTGGIQRSRKTNVLPTAGAKKELRKATEACDLLGETIHQVRVGTIDHRIAKTVGYLTSVLLHALNQGAVEERLERIEAALQAITEERKLKENVTAYDNASNIQAN